MRVVLVGGGDVNARLDIMEELRPSFRCAALGSNTGLAEEFSSHAFPFHYYPLQRGLSPASDLRTYLRLRELFSALRPDLVHTFDTKPNVWGRLAARHSGVPAVVGTLTGLGGCYVENGLRSRFVRLVYEPLQRSASRAADMTIFQNRDDLRQFVGLGIVPADKATVICGSGVKSKQYVPDRIGESKREELRRQIGIGPGEVVATMVARVCRSKGAMEFAAAAREVRKVEPRARFLLVGGQDQHGGDQLGSAEAEELRREVTWLGRRTDIAAIYAISQLAVLPSYYREGVPRALLEAASMGLPLVTTDQPGCRDVVENGVNGLLVPPRNVSALARAIVALVRNRELRVRFGQESRQRAVSLFDVSLVAERIAGVYHKLLLRREGGAPVLGPAECGA